MEYIWCCQNIESVVMKISEEWEIPIKILIGFLIIVFLRVLWASIFCDLPHGSKRIVTGYYDNHGKPIYVIEIYDGLDNGTPADWCACYWSRIDFHDYYTREEAEYALKYGEAGHRQ